MIPFVSNCQEKMTSVCLVGSWAKVSNGNDDLEMAENVFINRNNIKSLPEEREYLRDFREKHPDVKAALVDGIDLFDDQYFAVGESEAICMDPQQRMIMQGVIHALENAGISVEMAARDKIAVYTAAWAYDYKDLLPPDQYMATGNSASVMCGRITYFLNSRGAAVGIETACSSSLVAFHLARKAIISGETKVALVCGANHIGSRSFHSLYNSHMVSPNGRLAAFDRSANGFVRAESFAVAILCSKQYALDNNLNIECECIGSSFNSDGRTPSLTAPSPVAQTEVQLEAIGKIDRHSIQMVTCHGTGTKLGDQIELAAIKNSFKPDVRVMSPKSSLGHGEGAAGLIGVLQSLYSMKHNIIPNQLNLQLPSEELSDMTSMVFVNEENDLNRVAISSYGFGGTNSCAIIQKAEKQKPQESSYSEANVLFLSAKSMESLKLKISDYSFYLQQTNELMNDILYTENTRKTKYNVRAAVFGKSKEELAQKLEDNDIIFASNCNNASFIVEFGEGNEKLWLLRMLYERNETFRSSVDKYCKLAADCGFVEARTALFYPFKLTLTPLAYNISRLISSMATFDLLIEYQTLPEKIVGRGLGQVFSLACSQVISFNDAVNIIKTVVAEHNLDIVLNSIVLKDSITPIQYGNHISKSPKTEDIIDEIRKTPIPNLMSFNVNDIEIIENDPVRKVEKLMCHLFVSGYDINLKFRGKIVRTPGYSFLKRRFWPEVKELKRSEPLDAKTKISEQKNVSATDNIDVEGIIKSIVKKFTDIDDENCGLLESGSIDSLTSIEMVEAIGSAFKMQMPFDLLDTYPTTKNIVEFVSEKLPSSLVKALEPEVTDEPHNSKNNGLINIIAADFMFAGVNGERELWDALMTSRIVTGKISDQRRRQCGGDSGLTVGLLPQDISLFDNSFFSLPKDEALFIDPQHRLLMHAAYNALEKTGMTAIQDADLFVAISSHSEYRAIAEKYVTELDERLWMGTVHSMVAGRIATLLGVRGRAVLVDTTCSSVASALEMALNSIKQGRKYAIVATTQLIQSSRWTGSLKNLLDHFTTKSYSVDGEGFCRSDGVGVIILKAHEAGDSSLLQLSDAMTHHSGTVVTPVVSALSQLLDNVGKVKYIEGHGTATLAGDSAESIAYQKLGQEVVMSSVKAQFGHCEVASGLIQLLKVGAITRNGFIPAIVHNVLPNSHIRNCDNIRLPFVAEENDIEKAAIVSFGVTGTKSVVTTLKSRIEDNNLTPLSFILPMSAKTKDGINKMIHNFIEMLENSNESLYDISLAMQKQKTQFKWRSAVVGNNHTEVVKKLQRIVENGNRHVKNWCFSSTATNYISFFESIPEFEEKYTSFCQRLRFEPLSNPFSIYHFMAISYAFISIVLKHDITKKFAVSGMDSLILLAAIDAAPNHYLNDLMHSFASNDPRQMKRIARDVTVQIDSIEIVNLSGSPIKTARNAVDAALDVEIPNGVVIEENVLVLTGNEMFPNTKIIKSCSDYFEIIAEKYVKGDSIDFEEIFGQSRRFIELPEYPFNRKPFWLPYTMDTHNSKIETTNDISFSINDNKWKHVRNHVVDSQIVVPGATSIRIVYETLSNMVVTLYNIDFLNKIVPKDQSMTIKKEDDEANGMSTLLYDNLEAICCKAKPEEKDFKPLEMLLGTSCHQYDNEDIYHRFSLSQLIYRDGFQMIECIQYLNGNGMCQYVEIHDLDILIDGALQSIVVCYMFENPEDHSPFMPFTIDKIFISTDSLVGKKLKGYINYKYSDLFVTGSSTVYDDIGNVIIHIENVSFKRLHSVAPSSVSRAVTAARLRKGNSNEEARRSASQMLHEWFNDTFGWTDLDDTVGFFDLGLSSIQAVKLRNSIKSHYPDASSTCVFDYPTIEELSSYLSTLVNPEDKTLKKDLEEDDEEEEHQPPTRIAESPVGVMAAACRLPGGVRSPAELWQLLKIGKNASSRIPATRIPSRNVLISGSKYGTPVEGGNFIQDDISMFDPSFFKISKSEAEMIDPQQRILLECVQECLENSGVTETSDVGVFIGLMEKEYQDMIESTSILSMLGSMAAVIAGRINYVFGCNGPSVTIDTACSSSLVALEMAVNALLDKRCSRVLVAGVNLILNEKGQGLRTNGKMLSNHGMSLSFDSRASGYGRSDGCVVLMLEIAKPNYHYMSTIQAVNVNHGGHSVSLTAPNGVAHKMLLTNVINASPSLDINYWEAHGTGTPLGDPIEFNTLSSILQNILIGSVKASLGHGEASAGTCGLLKLFLMLTYQYVPTLIHFHVINKDINTGTIRLPVIGEENELNSAGISSFGVSGTNAAAICFNDNSKLVPYAAVHKKYILPLSAKNQTSLQRLEEDVMSIIAQTDVPISTIASSLANSRSHYSLRSAFIVSNTGITIGKTNGKLNKLQNKNKYLIRLTENLFDPSLLQFYTVDEFYTMAMLKYPQAFSLKYSVINFIKSISNYIQIVPMDNYELISCLLKDGLLDWKMFRAEMIELPTGSLLNELLSDFNLGPSNCNYISLLQDNINVNVNRTVNSLHDVMELITDMYINGYNIDWSSIYSPPQTYINLPNYYFNKQSLWFKEQDEVFDHYLVGSIEKEDEEQLVFMNLLSELRHPQLFRGKPVDVGTILEIAIEAAKVRTDIPFSLQNVNTHQIVLTKPVWLKTFISSEESGLRVTGMIDEQELFSVSITPFESDNVELPCMDVRIPEKVVFLQDCPNAIIRRNHNTFHVDSTAEVSPFRTANIVLNEIIGFTPNPSDMYLEILGPMVDAYYLVRVDDGALWQFQLISHDKKVLSNMYVLKDAKGLEVPMTRMHKKSTLLSSQEASNVAMKTLQMEIRTRLKKAFNDVIDSGLEIDESQLSTGFTELGLDSLATVDLLNRINQKYFTEIEITTGDLFDNPNIIDLSIRIEELLSEKNISNLPPSTTPTPKISMRKISIPAVKHQEMAQIEFVKQYDNQNIEANEQTDKLDKNEVKRKISTAVLDIATETVNADELETKGFNELGMDSLSVVDFINRLNEKYFPGEDIKTSDVFDYPTVNELTEHIIRKRSMHNDSNENGKDFHEVSNHDENSSEQIKSNILNDAYFLTIENSLEFKTDVTMSIDDDKKIILTKMNVNKIISPDDQTEIHSILNGTNLMIEINNFDGSIEELYGILLTFAKSLSKKSTKLNIAVSPTECLPHSVARAFFKTIASEKYPNIKYHWDQRVQQIRANESVKSIDGTWLITGGLSGVGYEIGRFIANNGADAVLLMSRRSPTNEILQDTAKWNSKVYTIACDVTDHDKLIREIERLNVRITGVVHSAGILKDAKLERQTMESFKQVFSPKADGFKSLEAIEEHFNYTFDHFIVMSSFTSACGNEGQLNYAVSNAFLEYQIQRRRNSGKSGCAIQWGNWIDTGMATNAQVRKFLANLGFLGQTNEVALKYLKMCIETRPKVIMVASLDWNKILNNRKDLPRDLVKINIVDMNNVANLDYSKKLTRNVKKCNDYSSKIGLNIFFNDNESLPKIKEEAIDAIKNGKSLRTSGSYCVTVTGSSIKELITRISNATQTKECGENKMKKSVLMLTGQGSQYPLMGRQLCENYAIFKETLQFCLKSCDKYLQSDIPLWNILFDTENYKELQLTKHMQPIMFSFGYSLAKLWSHFGFQPDYLLGHSVGELAAAVLAGILSLDDGLKLIVERGKAMEKISGLGALLAVKREIADDVQKNFNVSIATLNSPQQVVFAGTKQELDRALEYVKKNGKQGTFVNQRYPFHSNLIQESHLADLRQCLKKIQFKKAHIPVISNVTGKIIEVYDEEYVIKHTISAVNFVSCVENLQQLGVNTWVDAGPAAVLATFVKRIIPTSELVHHRILQTCKEKDSDIDTLLQSCLELEQAGVSINWNSFYGCDTIAEPKLVDFPKTMIFKITEEEYEYLKDHKLNGEIIIAGVYQITKLKEFLENSGNAHDVVLRNVKFTRPWYDKDGHEFKIQWKSDNIIELRVNGNLMCTAIVSNRDENEIEKIIPTDEVEFDVARFYKTLYKNGLQYEDRFRVILNAKRSNKRCFANMKTSQFLWPIIDGAMHSITASVIERRPDSYFLPVSFGYVHIDDYNTENSRMRATTTIISETDKFIQVNVGLYDSDKIVCEIRNMTIVVVKREEKDEAIKSQVVESEQSEIQIVGFDYLLPNMIEPNNTIGWNFLKTNKHRPNELVSKLDIDIKKWDPEYFRIRPSEAQFIDPQQRLLLNSIARLLNTFAINLPKNTGVFVGSSTHEFSHLVYANAKQSPMAEFATGTCSSSMAGRISHYLQLNGPSITIDTSCSSSLTALSIACDYLKAQKCDYAIVLSANLVMHDMTTNVLLKSKMIVHDGCKVFDTDANGYQRSEAICTILLTRLPDYNGIAQVLNWSVGHNGQSSSLYTPNSKSQIRVMKEALGQEKTTKIVSHCTGTKLGDPLEMKAVSTIFQSQLISVNGIKSNIGHCEGSSGLIAICLSIIQHMNTYELPQLHLKKINENFDEHLNIYVRFVGEETNYLSSETVLINNFGFTGTNCSVLLKLKPNDEDVNCRDSMIYYPLILSSHSKSSLKDLVKELENFINDSDCSLNYISETLKSRAVKPYRIALIYNYKRKLVWRSNSEHFNYNNLNNQLIPLIKDCRSFIEEGEKQGMCNSYVDLRSLMKIPSVKFDDRKYWPFKEKSERYENHECNRQIFYQRKYIHLEPHCNYNNSNDIILYEPKNDVVQNYLKLINLWKNTDRKFIIVACVDNSTMYTEFTGMLRSLAAEKRNKFKFVSYETRRQLENELNESDAFEAIFYKNNLRYVERLEKVNAKVGRKLKRWENVLISGGSGGIGQTVIDFFEIEKCTILTRQRIENQEGRKYVQCDFSDFYINEYSDYDAIFHFAGLVQNATHSTVSIEDLNAVLVPKYNGAIKLSAISSEHVPFIYSSSVAAILGSFGQSNYAYANGLVTSMLQKSNKSHQIIHWGPWRDVGMLSDNRCNNIRRQIEMNGWNLLSNEDAMSVFQLPDDVLEDVVVFDGDWDVIYNKHEHLKPLLSNIVKEKVDKVVSKTKTFEQVFQETTGILITDEMKEKPFMDIGIDSLCLETLRQKIHDDIGVELNISDLFENANYKSLFSLVCNKNKKPEFTTNFGIEDHHDKIAIIGWSAEFTNSMSIEEFWNNLLEGKDCLEKPKNDHYFNFDYNFFNITREDAQSLDPQIRRFIQHCYRALEHSGYINLRKSLKCSVFAGAEPSDYGSSQQHDDALRKMFAMNMNNHLATYAAYCLDLKGEATSIYTACSTTLVAVSHAISCLKNNQSDLAIVGASSLAYDSKYNGKSDEKKTIFSNNSRPFDASSNGIERGSGVGCIVLKCLSKAISDNDNILSVINTYSINNDGHNKASFMAPNPTAQRNCMTEVLDRLSEDEKERIRYIEGHATGTKLGDEMELNSLKTAYSFKKSIMVGSCKANIGHAYAASGLASIIKASMMLQTGIVPPQIKFNKVQNNAFRTFFDINKEKTTISRDSLIGINCFGIGGTNVHLLLEGAPNFRKSSDVQSNECYQVGLISAKTESSLLCLKELIKSKMNSIYNSNLGSKECMMIYNTKRECHFRQRTFLMTRKYKGKVSIEASKRNYQTIDKPRVCFFFAPQGIQFSNILSNDYFDDQSMKEYRREIDKLCDIANEATDLNFNDIIYGSNDLRIYDVDVSQVALLIQSVAIAKTLISFGVQPNLLIGHSLGEYTAAVISGGLCVRDAILLLYKRSKLIEETKEAKMILVWKRLTQLPGNIEATSFIDSEMTCYVGPEDEIEQFCKQLSSENIKYKSVETKRGFHSSMLKAVQDLFYQCCWDYRFKTFSIPVISSITGDVMNTLTAKYLADHLCNAVNFEKIMDQVVNQKIDVIVEIGPSGILEKLVERKLLNIQIIPTCGTKKKPIPTLKKCLGCLWSCGVDSVLEEMNKRTHSNELQTYYDFPGYQFDDICLNQENTGDIGVYTTHWNPLIDSGKYKTNELTIRKTLGKEKLENVLEDVLAINLDMYSNSDYITLYLNTNDILKHNYNVKMILFVSTRMLDVHFVALGLIRYFQLINENRAIFVENYDNLCIEQLADVLYPISHNNYVRIDQGRVSLPEYTKIKVTNDMTMSNNKPVIIIGASGEIGTVFMKLLRKIINSQIITISRHDTNYPCDITKHDDVDKVFQKISRTYKSFAFVINCAGKETSKNISKETDDVEKVLNIKIQGNINVISAIEKYHIKVEHVIICSSLSSITPIFGNEDYTSANCVVDQLGKTCRSNNIKSVLSIGFCGIKGSRMIHESSDGARRFIEQNSIEKNKLETILRKVLKLSGSIYISKIHPTDLVEKVLEVQKGVSTLSTPKPSEISVIEAVKNIWSETIGTEQIIRNDTDFFQIGGDSLNALQATWKTQTITSKMVHVDDLFKYPVLEEYVNFINSLEVNETKNKTVEVDWENIPVTESQKQMIILRKVDETSKYNIIFQLKIKINNRFELKKFKIAILHLIAHQRSYRTRFPNDKQLILSLTEVYFNLNSIDSTTELWDKIIDSERKNNFDIANEVPLRIIINIEGENLYVLFNQHHILTDGYSMTILAHNIESFYMGNTDIEDNNSMASWAARELNTDNSTFLEKHRNEYKNFKHSIIPYDKCLPTNHRRFENLIDKNIWNNVVKLAQDYKTTPYIITLALFTNSVHSFCNSESLLFAYASSGRNELNSNLIGYCMNNVLFKINVRSQEFNEMVKEVISEFEKTRRFQSLPFHQVVDMTPHLKNISIYFNYRQKLDYPRVKINDSYCNIEHLSINNAFDFSFTIDEKDDQPIICVDYDFGKYDEETIKLFIESFYNPFSQYKTSRVLIRDYPKQLIHRSLIEQLRDSSKLANHLDTYSDLLEKSEKIAQEIQNQGLETTGELLREDDMVGLDSKLGESYILACALLGLAYAPFEGSWPKSRKNYVGSCSKLMIEHKMNTFELNKRRFITNRKTRFGSMYTIFTSGSTGEPKGVVISEHSLSSFLTTMTSTCYIREGINILDKVNPIFDVSVSNIFGALTNQSCLLKNECSVKKGQYTFLTSAVFNTLTDKQMHNLSNNYLVTVGGESVQNSALNRALEKSIRVRQIYGPTETCIWTTTKRCKKDEGNIIGSCVPNIHAFIKNNRVRGELIIEGESVGRGYLSVNCSSHISFDGRFATGDIVDIRNGVYRFIGRNDAQFKYHGIRIDLGQLENEISKLLDAMHVKLIIIDQMLIAFFVSNEKLRYDYIYAKINGYVTHIPDQFVFINKIPVNSNGKLSHRNLLQAFNYIRKSYVNSMEVMSNSVEQRVLTDVSEILNKPVKLNESFTMAGGNSLKAIQLEERINEDFGSQIKAHDILQADSIQQLSSLISRSIKKPLSKMSKVITNLRDVPGAKLSIYLIHAIGGTIYPYYSFLQIFPKNIALYGIEYDLSYPSENLKTLTSFYANEIAAHAKTEQIFVMGHSMGGIMSREIVNELRIWGYNIPFVILFDSWVLRANELDVENIRSFLMYVFSGLPDSERRLDRAIKLAHLLREYRTPVSDTKLILFKSKRLGDAAFKSAVRTDLNEELSRSMLFNGFDELSTQAIDTHIIDGDHESCLKVENLKKVKEQIIAPFKPYI